MLKLISVVIEIFMFKKSITKSASVVAYFEKTVEQARGYFLFSIGCVISLLFLMIALVVAVIGIGLQIEQHGSVSFSGLMISATLFVIIAAFTFLVSIVHLILQKQKMAVRQQIQEQQTASSSVMPLVEQILKQILVNLVTPKSSSAGKAQADSTKN